MRLPRLLRQYLLRLKLRQLLPLRRNRWFRMHLRARRQLLQLSEFQQLRPLPLPPQPPQPPQPPVVRFHRPRP